MNDALRQKQLKLGKEVTLYLINQMDKKGHIFDFVDNAPTPIDQYAQTFLGWACLNLGLIKQADLALSAFFQRPQGWMHSADFNSFALANIFIHQKYCKLNESIKKQISDYLNSPLFRSRQKHNISNNWWVMDATTLAIVGKAKRRRIWAKKAKYIIKKVMGWQLEDGIFPDFPNNPCLGNLATPLTYHAKICAMLLRYSLLVNDEASFHAAQKGIEVLCYLIFRDGAAFQFGRTNMGLFGYACAMDALNHLINTKTQNKKLFAETTDAILSKLEQMQDSQGYIALNPAGNVAERPSWDSYMHLTVYNAYFAAFATAEIKRQLQELRPAETVKQPVIFHLPASGLIHAMKDDVEALISLQGQAVQGQGHIFCDNRYSGMSICHLTYKQVSVIPTPPLSTKQLEDPFDPSSLGFSPCFMKGNNCFGYRLFDSIHVEENNMFLQIQGTARPMYFQTIDWATTSKYERAILKLERFLAKKPVNMFKRRDLFWPILKRIMFLHFSPFFMGIVDRIWGLTDIEEIFSPTVRIPNISWKIVKDGLEFADISGEKWVIKFLPNVNNMAMEKELWSSDGQCKILSYPIKHKKNSLTQTILLTMKKDEPSKLSLNCNQEKAILYFIIRDKEQTISLDLS